MAQSIVVVRQRPSMGDCILLSPLIREIKKAHPRCRLTVVTDNSWSAGVAPQIFAMMPGVDRIECVNSWEWTTQSNRLVDPNLRGVGTEAPHSVKKAAKVYDCNGGFIQFERDTQGKPPYGIAEFWLRLFDFPTTDCLPRLNYDGEHGMDWVEDQGWCSPEMGGKDIIGFALRTGSPIRDINQERLKTLGQWAQSSGFLPVSIDPTQQLPPMTPVVGRKISEVASIIGQMRLLVTPDTGLLHLAQAIGIPTVALWGIMEPELRVKDYDCVVVPKQSLGPCENPDCTQCRWAFQQWSCMSKLTPHMMISGIEEALERHRS